MTNLIIDFDSTICAKETLEVMAHFALKNDPNKLQILKKIEGITNLGMNGQISFVESLNTRINTVRITKPVINETIDYLKKHISKSFVETTSLLLNYNYYIVSGGFKKIIDPILSPLGLESKRIFANNLIRSDKTYKLDTSFRLTKDKGKVDLVKSLKLSGNTYVIGDGYSDYELKLYGLADKFIYYSEFVSREAIKSKSDYEISSFVDLYNISDILTKKRYQTAPVLNSVKTIKQTN